ncbi:MAG: MBL fold metallo-hydrolase [Gemmatimonadetes bacterium]|nr:MBL fold metallo-hydrolase [Gemmatimonadota bacterium]
MCGWGVGVGRALAAVTIASWVAAMAPAPSNAQEPPTGGSLRIEYIAHASFRITGPQGTRVLLDPYADRIWLGYEFPKGLEADAVVITHPHYDHDGGEFRGRPVPWPEHQRVLRYPGRYSVGEIDLVGVTGKHADPDGHEFGQRNTIWVVEVGGLRIAHFGDNGPLTDAVAAALGRIDILMLPLDADYHILSSEAIEHIMDVLKPMYLIPMHYRIPELEPGEGPIDLGPRQIVTRGVDGMKVVSRNILDLPAGSGLTERRILVFTPSPLVPAR